MLYKIFINLIISLCIIIEQFFKMLNAIAKQWYNFLKHLDFFIVLLSVLQKSLKSFKNYLNCLSFVNNLWLVYSYTTQN